MGRAFIDIDATILAEAVSLFPRTYRVVGSEACPYPHLVRLIVESDDIAEGWQGQIICEVRDVGSTRTVRMMPCS